MWLDLAGFHNIKLVKKGTKILRHLFLPIFKQEQVKITKV